MVNDLQNGFGKITNTSSDTYQVWLKIWKWDLNFE